MSGPLELELDSFRQLCGFWELNLSPLVEQSVLNLSHLSSTLLGQFLSRLLLHQIKVIIRLQERI